MEPLTHKPKADTEWNESYYFVFYDKIHDFGGMTRIGFKPNKQEGTTFFIFFMPDGTTALYQSLEKITDRERKENIQVGAVTHQSLQRGKWKYMFQGKMVVARHPEDFLKMSENPQLASQVLAIDMDLSFTPINDVYEYSEHMTAESRELGKKSGDAHWEQIGKINGKILFDDHPVSIRDVLGQRDHSHGVRDWTGIGNWLYYVIWFSDHFAVNPAAIIADDGRISTGGFIFKNGRNIPIKTIHVLDQKFRNNIFPVSSKLELVDDLGQKHILEGEAGPIAPIPFTDREGQLSILTQSFGSFRLDGISGGYGTFETLRKAR